MPRINFKWICAHKGDFYLIYKFWSLTLNKKIKLIQKSPDMQNVEILPPADCYYTGYVYAEKIIG